MNTFISAVNQKMAYVEALLQGAVLQLEMAFRFYLREIAEVYQCKNARDIGDLWTLIANLQLLGKNPEETREIYNLNGRPDSWLSDLLDCCRGIAVPQESVRTKDLDDNRIAAVSISQRHDWSRLSPELVESWLVALSEMLERHRQAMVEC
jgi:hypothetical protein